MRPPDFWRASTKSWPPPLAQWALTPASWLYDAISQRRMARHTAVDIAAKVVSVGGVSIGGSGKTPVARALRQRLLALGRRPAILSRGYGGQARGVRRVDPNIHTAHEVGDEPLLHARDGLALISRDRMAGALAAIAAGADTLILDDAHQNGTLRKHLSILVLDGPEGLGNGAVFPAGPLREPLARALARADCLVCMNGAQPPLGCALPAFSARIIANASAPAGPLFAFAGIAFPGRFFETLRENGAQIADLLPFPDHYFYAERELQDLLRLATHHGARLITTQKDWVRLPIAWRDRVLSFDVSLEFSEPAKVDALLRRALAAPQ